MLFPHNKETREKSITISISLSQQRPTIFSHTRGSSASLLQHTPYLIPCLSSVSILSPHQEYRLTKRSCSHSSFFHSRLSRLGSSVGVGKLACAYHIQGIRVDDPFTAKSNFKNDLKMPSATFMFMFSCFDLHYSFCTVHSPKRQCIEQQCHRDGSIKRLIRLWYEGDAMNKKLKMERHRFVIMVQALTCHNNILSFYIYKYPIPIFISLCPCLT